MIVQQYINLVFLKIEEFVSAGDLQINEWIESFHMIWYMFIIIQIVNSLITHGRYSSKQYCMQIFHGKFYLKMHPFLELP